MSWKLRNECDGWNELVLSSVGDPSKDCTEPTLGICYGRFKTVDKGKYLHIGGQAFWELISREPDLYMDIVEPIGHRAREFNDAFYTQRANAMNRMALEFMGRFCRPDGSIDWPKVVTLVSKTP